jgi:hypothetical protein
MDKLCWWGRVLQQSLPSTPPPGLDLYHFNHSTAQKNFMGDTGPEKYQSSLEPSPLQTTLLYDPYQGGIFSWVALEFEVGELGPASSSTTSPARGVCSTLLHQLKALCPTAYMQHLSGRLLEELQPASCCCCASFPPFDADQSNVGEPFSCCCCCRRAAA